jgi:hypothetical protein
MGRAGIKASFSKSDASFLADDGRDGKASPYSSASFRSI